MQSQNRFFDDLSKVLNGLAGTVAGVGREAEAGARERAKEWFGGMDFVSRDEFEAVKEMAAKARAEADALKKRLDALEKTAPAAKRPAARKTAARKPAARKPAVRKTAAPKTTAKPATKKPGSSK
jgi:BMFP domain-containing protein YqiC